MLKVQVWDKDMIGADDLIGHLTPLTSTSSAPCLNIVRPLHVNDMLKVQVWDKDMIGADDLIGETLIPLSTLVGKK
ncbi:hypothetical protein T484DRAFT_1818610 [Baffinella frigidus]|nr:hypothetical protein T484DRAFT_1818610 [Cryptophyta sp. CCMP2293]